MRTLPNWLSPHVIWPLDGGLLALMALRAAMIVSMVAWNLPPLQSHIGWYFHHGGDQDYYFAYAEKLLEGSFDQFFAVNLGESALMTIPIVLWGAQSYEDLLAYAVIINGFMLGTLSIALVGRITWLVSRNSAAALLAAGVWASTPLLIWLFFWPFPNGIWLQAPHVPGSAWLQALPDGPAVFFSLGGLYLVLRAFEAEHWPLALAAGAAFGAALLFKAHMIVYVLLATGVVLLWAALRRDWRAALAFAAGGVLAYLPQAAYNQMHVIVHNAPLTPADPQWLRINPFLPGYLYFGVFNPGTGWLSQPDLSPVDLGNVLANLGAFATRFGAVVWLVVAVATIAALALAWHAFRTLDWPVAVLVLGSAPAAVGINLLSAYFVDDPVRFLIPALPFGAVLGAWLVASLWQVWPGTGSG